MRQQAVMLFFVSNKTKSVGFFILLCLLCLSLSLFCGIFPESVHPPIILPMYMHSSIRMRYISIVFVSSVSVYCLLLCRAQRQNFKISKHFPLSLSLQVEVEIVRLLQRHTLNLVHRFLCGGEDVCASPERKSLLPRYLDAVTDMRMVILARSR